MGAASWGLGVEKQELRVWIGRAKADGHYPISVRFFSQTDGTYDFESELAPLKDASPEAFQTVLTGITKTVVDAASGAWKGGHVDNGYWPTKLLLEIDEPDAYQFDWKNSLLTPAYLSHFRSLALFRAASDERVLEPFELPVRVLQVRWMNAAIAKPSEGAMRYFQLTQISGIAGSDLHTAIRSRYDIVHLPVHARISRAGTDGNLISVEESWNGSIDVPRLRRMLLVCKARFLILQCADQLDFEPALDFAHRLLRMGGPTTLVAAGVDEAFLNKLYMSVVHDEPMEWMAQPDRGGARTALFHAIGGDRVLRIKPLLDRLIQRTERNVSTGARLLQTLGQLRDTLPRPLQVEFGARRGDIDRLADLVAQSRSAASRIYDYTRETGAWIPYQQDVVEQAARATRIDSMRRAVDRVVNVGVLENERKLGSGDALKPGGRYELSVQIGPRASWSLVDGDAAFPEGALAGKYEDGGLELRVVVFGSAFDIPEPDRQLQLQPPPALSKELRFVLTAPKEEGRHRIRICIYHHQNLLQSILVHATVGASKRTARARPMIEAEVEFALSSTLADIDRFPQRVLNLLMNEADDGSHTMAIVGGSLRSSFDFGETEMRSAVDAARQALSDIAADNKGKSPKYRFDRNNSATIEQLKGDTLNLAELGYQLYANIVTSKDRKFAGQLSASLGHGGATIQISAVKSARYVFPWALVYDKPLVIGALTFCPKFEADARATKAGAPLASQCLEKGCPNWTNNKIVCPSGFWGLKHLIEQPLSVSLGEEAAGESDLMLEIDAGAQGGIGSALVVVSRELSQVRDHETDLRGVPSFKFEIKDTKVDACERMSSRAPKAHVVYFYCHGGRDKTKTWLGIGTNERLVPSDLTGSGIDWTGIHPLVFINGCHTADFSPDDLLNFNQVFAWCQAAGVIGTEISIPESLAREFATGFLAKFGAGISVAQSMLSQRLDLLARRNLLGLAYTPYCSGELKMVRH